MNLFYIVHLVTPTEGEDHWEILEAYDNMEEAIETAILIQNVCRFGSWCEITLENWG